MRLRSPSVRAEALANLLFAFARLLLLLYLTRLTALLMTPAHAGLFLLARRIAATGAGFAQLGTSQTMLRYMSLHIREDAIKWTYAVIGLLFSIVLALLALPIAWASADLFGALLFADEGAGALAFWTVVNIVATVAGFAVNTQHVAERRVWASNLLRMLLVGGASLAALLWLQAEADPVSAMRLTAVILALGVGAAILVQIASIRLTWTGLRSHLSEAAGAFVRYGLPRGLIAGLDTLTALIGPWLLRDNPVEAGFLIIAYTLFRLLDAAILPAAQVVATACARAMGANDQRLTAQAVRLGFGAAILVGAMAIAFVAPWLDRILHLWLGSDMMAQGVYGYAQWTIWSVLPVCVFLSLRAIIEIRYVFPYNLISLVSGLAVVLIVYYGGPILFDAPERAALIAGLLAMDAVRGALTLFWLRRDLRDIAYFGLGRILTCALVIGAMQSLAAHYADAMVSILSLVASLALLYWLIAKFPSGLITELVGYLRRRKS